MPKDYGAPPPVRKHPRLKDKKEPAASVLSPSPPLLSVKRPQSTGPETNPRRFSRQQHQRNPEQNGMPGLVPAPPLKQNNNATSAVPMPKLQTPAIASKSDDDGYRLPTEAEPPVHKCVPVVPHPIQVPKKGKTWRRKRKNLKQPTSPIQMGVASYTPRVVPLRPASCSPCKSEYFGATTTGTAFPKLKLDSC